MSSASAVLASTLFLDLQLQSGMQDAFNDQTAEQQTYSPSPPQGIFALQKSLRGDCGGDGVPAAVGRGTARAKKFPEEICFAPRRVLQICRTPDYLVTQKYVTTPDWENLCTGQPRGARGTAVPLFREESRGPLPRGSFGQLLRGGSTPRFFSQIRSVGSKPPGWQGTASQPLVPRTTEYQSPGASLRGFCVIPQSHSLQDFSAYQYRSLFAARYNTQTAADSPRPATAGTSAPCRAQS